MNIMSELLDIEIAQYSNASNYGLALFAAGLVFLGFGFSLILTIPTLPAAFASFQGVTVFDQIF